MIDRVLAIYGDSVVTYSRISDALNQAIEAEGGADRLSDLAKHELTTDLVRRAVRDDLYAYLSRSVGDAPANVDRWVTQKIEERIKEQTALAGGSSSFLKKLEAMGLTFQQYEENVRTDTRREVYIFDALRRKLDVESQYWVVTPAEMRSHWRLHRDQFVQPERGDIDAVAVQLGPPDAEARAQRAVAGLRAGKSTADVARDVGGDVFPWPDVRAGGGKPQAFVDFVHQHKVGECDGPIRINESLWALRLTARSEASDGRFENPAVQQKILEQLRTERRNALLRKLDFEQQQRAFTWPKDLFTPRRR